MPRLHTKRGHPMGTVIAFPSAAERGHLAIDRAQAEFDTESGTGIEQMIRHALEHTESDVRTRASRWLAEVLNVATV